MSEKREAKSDAIFCLLGVLATVAACSPRVPNDSARAYQHRVEAASRAAEGDAALQGRAPAIQEVQVVPAGVRALVTPA